MSRKPCFGRECRAYCEEHCVENPGGAICALCGAEGPMCDWFIERDLKEEEKAWMAEQRRK